MKLQDTYNELIQALGELDNRKRRATELHERNVANLERDMENVRARLRAVDMLAPLEPPPPKEDPDAQPATATEVGTTGDCPTA